MSCCNLWSAGENCSCGIPTSPDPKDGRVWCRLNQAWVEGVLTKDENDLEVEIEDSENASCLRQRIEELEHYLKLANAKVEKLEQALAKYDHRDHTL